MKILIGCEFSGIVRDAFLARGHDAMSCDLLKSERPGPHYQGDIFDVIHEGWDLAIFFPPCPYLTVTANKWYFHPDDKDLPKKQRRPHPRFPDRQLHRQQAIEFFMKLADADIPKIAIENPVGIMSTVWRKPDQIIDPIMFGHPEPKKTCLWLKGLPLLIPTKKVEPEYVISKSGKKLAKWYYFCEHMTMPERQKVRNRTFEGIGNAFAN